MNDKCTAHDSLPSQSLIMMVPLDQLPSYRITTPTAMSKYEKTRLVGTRACSLNAENMVPLIKMQSNDDALAIAQKELVAGVLPALIRRHFPNGSFHDCAVQDLEIL
jgi:DNA-directed RNA polymerase subunit K/omega